MRRGTEFARELEFAETARLMSVRAREAMAGALQQAKASQPPAEPAPGEAVRAAQVAELTELVDNLNKHIASQPVIEQAKGILMARSHCTPDEAFDQLRRASMRRNVKVRDIARGLVESTSAGLRRRSENRAVNRTAG